MARRLFTFAFAVALTTTGCASSVRFVARQPHGGVLRAHGPVVPRTRELYAAMTDHCRGHWRLLEGTEAVGMLSWNAAAHGLTALPPDEIAFACESR